MRFFIGLSILISVSGYSFAQSHMQNFVKDFVRQKPFSDKPDLIQIFTVSDKLPSIVTLISKSYSLEQMEKSVVIDEKRLRTAYLKSLKKNMAKDTAYNYEYKQLQAAVISECFSQKRSIVFVHPLKKLKGKSRYFNRPKYYKESIIINVDSAKDLKKFSKLQDNDIMALVHKKNIY